MNPHFGKVLLTKEYDFGITLKRLILVRETPKGIIWDYCWKDLPGFSFSFLVVLYNPSSSLLLIHFGYLVQLLAKRTLLLQWRG